MTAKDQHKKFLKKELIVKTAEQLFNRHGIKRVTVEEICRTAGVSKMTFYKYYLNKIELVRCLWNRWIDEGLLKLDENDALNIPLPEKIQRMFEWKSNFLSNISKEFIKDILPLNLGYERIIQRFNEFIINAQKRGEIRSTIKPEFLITVLNKLYELARRDEDLRSKYSNLIEFNREFKDFFWYGVISR
jgi:AcrR family transcriptional regulator